MKSGNYEIGNRGEKLAKEYLEELGYKIIAENFQIYLPGRGGKKSELDLVAVKNNLLVFVEVKTRTSEKFGPIISQITPAKIKALIYGANYFILKGKNQFSSMQCRFDLIMVDGNDKIEHLENIISG